MDQGQVVGGRMESRVGESHRGRVSSRCTAAASWLTTAAVMAGALAVVGASAANPPRGAAISTAAQDWPTYLHDGARSSASTEAILTATNASTLKQKWAFATGGSIVDSAAVVNGVAYIGSWDGYEYAVNATTGGLIWKTNLGQTTDPNCTYPTTAGITSAATVQGNVLYVGGGGPNWYALDTATGNILWSVPTGDNSPAGGHYNWSSPLIYTPPGASNAFAYIGIASNCDNPLVQGQLLQVNLSTHAITNIANFVPNGQVGAGVWTSPTVDAASNTIFVSTGTINVYTQTMSQAIVALDATTLAIKSSWQLPFEQETYDSDWGTTPTLTTDINGHQLLSLANKNGYLYTFNRNNIGAGPIWQRQIALGGDCPTCGDGTISSGTFVANATVSGVSGTYTGPVLFYAAGAVVLNGVGYQGSVSALNPADGTILWTHYTQTPVDGALAYDNGLIIDAQLKTVEVLNASNGQSLWDYNVSAPIYAAPSVSRGQIYVGGTDNNLYAFGLPASNPAPPADANCPAGWTCQDVNGATPGSETQNSDGSLTVTFSGSDIHGASDSFRFISKNIAGDSQLVTQLTQQSTQNTQPQAGLMYRESNAFNAPFFAMLEYPNNLTENLPAPKIVIWYRPAWNANSVEVNRVYPASLPLYMMIQRRGDVFSASMSTDGVNYRLIPGTTRTIVMPTPLMAGLAMDSGKNTTFGTATFNHYSAGPISVAATPTPTAHACPAPWRCLSVDNPTPMGDQTLSNGTWTLQGAGFGIGSGFHAFYGKEDSFHFVYQALTGDQTISARFTGFGANPPANAEAGLMMRASSDPNAPYYGIFLYPGTKGGIVQWRVNPNIVSRATYIQLPALVAPVYLQISRFTDTRFNPAPVYYSAATSPDGVHWNPVYGSTAAIDMGGGSNGPTLAGMAADATAARTLVPVTFTSFSSSATQDPPPGICENGWTCADVGNSHVVGNQTYIQPTWTVQASGDLWDVYDQFRFAWQSMPGDGTVTARVVSTANGGEWQKSGVMIRAGATDPQAPYYAVLSTPQHGVVVQWRASEAAITNQVQLGSGSAPIYLMAARYTDTNHAPNVTYYYAETSSDNVHWSVVPNSIIALNLPGNLSAGIAATSYTSFLATSTFDSFNILPAAPAPPGICPAAWNCADVGGALPPGTQNSTGNSWTIAAGGSDIWDVADQFHFMYQSLAGDGTVVAHVTAAANVAQWAKGGVMLRASADPGSPYYGVFVTPNNGVALQWRGAAGASTSQIIVAGTAPQWLMVDRWTDQSASPPATYYQALTSSDGTTWTPVPNSTLVLPALSGTLLAGIAADSWNQGVAATWTMDGIAVSTTGLQPQGICTSGWNCEDIGGSAPVGAQNNASGVWTVQGGGYDVWNTMDQFRFVGQTLAADGSVTAHVQSQSNTSPWAKAGVMLRVQAGDPDPQAPYYGVFVTPANGVQVQYRTAEGGVTTAINVPPLNAPVWLRVSRWTDASGASPVTYYTAYTSTDGSAWSVVAGSTLALNMPGTLLAGMAVTSHNVGTLSSAMFDSVAIGGSAAEPPGVCSANYLCADIGMGTLAGSQSQNGATMAVQGGGADIWGTSDQCHAVMQSLAGDGTVQARIASYPGGADPWAKAGLMVRASTDPSAPYYAVFLTPGNGIVVQHRDGQGATSTGVQVSTLVAPVYLQITRTGTTFSAAVSTDGSTWTPLAGSTVSMPALGGALLAGLAVTSHNNSVLWNVVFDSLAL